MYLTTYSLLVNVDVYVIKYNGRIRQLGGTLDGVLFVLAHLRSVLNDARLLLLYCLEVYTYAGLDFGKRLALNRSTISEYTRLIT